MDCEVRKARYLSEISTVRELKEARRELEIREWFARERLEADILDTFTLENLLSIVAPPGSLVDRMIGGVGTGLSVAQGLFGIIGSFLSGRGSKRHVPARTSRSSRSTASTRTTRSASSVKGRAAAKGATVRKRTPEIEVEVELEEPKPRRSRS